MDKVKIIEFLKQNELSNIEEINYKENAVVVRFTYEFDDLEVEAAKAYANDESEDEEEGEIWYEEFFYPYLSDLAIDNVGEILEELMESRNIEAQFVSYEIDEEDYGYNEFIAVFTSKENEVDIEQVLEELNL